MYPQFPWRLREIRRAVAEDARAVYLPFGERLRAASGEGRVSRAFWNEGISYWTTSWSAVSGKHHFVEQDPWSFYTMFWIDLSDFDASSSGFSQSIGQMYLGPWMILAFFFRFPKVVNSGLDLVEWQSSLSKCMLLDGTTCPATLAGPSPRFFHTALQRLPFGPSFDSLGAFYGREAMGSGYEGVAKARFSFQEIQIVVVEPRVKAFESRFRGDQKSHQRTGHHSHRSHEPLTSAWGGTW